MKKFKLTKGKKIALAVFLVIVLTITIGFAYLKNRLDYNYVEIEESDEELGIVDVTKPEPESEEVIEEPDPAFEKYVEVRENTLNVLLLGVDSSNYVGVRSDIMMLLTIRKDTGEIKLTSLMRDTMAYIPERGTYEKLNHAYAYNGASGAIKAVNTNYDLDIRDFVAFDYDAIKRLVNVIGGVSVYVDSAEKDEMNVELIGDERITSTGQQVLNGEQALMYTRIRHNSGGDAGRNERQREVLDYIFERSKSFSYKQLFNIVDAVLPYVYTSYDYSDVVSFVDLFLDLRTGTSLQKCSFPFTHDGTKVDALYYEVPSTLESNVISLHDYLFDYGEYEPSSVASFHSNKIEELTGIHENVEEHGE